MKAQQSCNLDSVMVVNLNKTHEIQLCASEMICSLTDDPSVRKFAENISPNLMIDIFDMDHPEEIDVVTAAIVVLKSKSINLMKSLAAANWVPEESRVAMEFIGIVEMSL